MALQLKPYQERALAALADFLARCRGATTAAAMQEAFVSAHQQALGEGTLVRSYRPFSANNPEVPVACLRIPTGGGKTLMAAHAIEISAREYLGTRAPIALWLVPSNAVRRQTLEALRTPGHPYREALLRHWPDDRLLVLDIDDCHRIRAHDIGSRAIVIVGTVQTLRVENTASREVYAYHEDFVPHFAAVPNAEWFERVSEDDLLRHPHLTRSDLGRIKASFANLLAWHRPIVIMDEAHNAQSRLSLTLLERIRPGCVIEWTATPLPEQNVLYSVSAEELKAEAMIKLPVVLVPHLNWQEAVHDAVLTRERLAEDAAEEPDYLRPIVLIQAEPRGGVATVEVIKARLIEDLHIEERRIAVATGNQRGLDGVDLFRRDCPIDFIITVEALKEGWDCSFAYVFCTAQNIGSAKDMEQLLGRVLRMPYARRRKADTLNRAYAHVCGPRTAKVACQLTDRLVNMGFERLSAVQAVQVPADDMFESTPPPTEVQSYFETTVAAARVLQATLSDQVEVEYEGDVAHVTVTGQVPADTMQRVEAHLGGREREQLEENLRRHEARVQAAVAPSRRGEVFAAVPQLVIPIQGSLRLYEPELLGELADYSLAGLPADLPGIDRTDSPRPFLIDVERGRLGVREDQGTYLLDMDFGPTGVVRPEDIVRALDRRLYARELLQSDKIAWLARLVEGLIARGMDEVWLSRHINNLSEQVAARLRTLLGERRNEAFQQSLLPGPDAPRLDESLQFRFDPQRYPARWFYEGPYRFQRHYFPVPGELQPRGEETDCAIEIDRLPEVRYWVRNLDRQPVLSFWLPTSTDRFYPDFVAELSDGRLFVIEYKGAHLRDAPDAREKDLIGKVWAQASDGRCLFLMATDEEAAGMPVSAQLRRAISGT